MILKDENMLYIYFEAMEQIEPKRVLDIGMLLKRFGCVSRRAMNREVPETIGLTGIDFFPKTRFPVWENVYNKILDAEEFMGSDLAEEYELTVLLGTEAFMTEALWTEFAEKLWGHTRYILTDCLPEQWSASVRFRDLKVENDSYFLIEPGER